MSCGRRRPRRTDSGVRRTASLSIAGGGSHRWRAPSFPSVVREGGDETEILFGDQIVALRGSRPALSQFEHAPRDASILSSARTACTPRCATLVFGRGAHFEKDLGYASRRSRLRVSPARRGRLRRPQRAGRHGRTRRAERTTARSSCSSSPRTSGAAPTATSTRRRPCCGRFIGTAGGSVAQILDRLDARVGALFRSREQDPNGALVEGPRRPGRRRRVLRLAAAGQGSALAMTAAYALAGELAKAPGQHEQAFRAYETLLRPYIEVKQRGAERFLDRLCAAHRVGPESPQPDRNALALPGVGRFVIGRGLVDTLALPDYAWPPACVMRPPDCHAGSLST